MTTATPYRCPKCPVEDYYGRLDLPTVRRRPCPNCGTKLVPVPKRSEQPAQ